jgi:hypothetical protein
VTITKGRGRWRRQSCDGGEAQAEGTETCEGDDDEGDEMRKVHERVRNFSVKGDIKFYVTSGE